MTEPGEEAPPPALLPSRAGSRAGWRQHRRADGSSGRGTALHWSVACLVLLGAVLAGCGDSKARDGVAKVTLESRERIRDRSVFEVLTGNRWESVPYVTVAVVDSADREAWWQAVAGLSEAEVREVSGLYQSSGYSIGDDTEPGVDPLSPAAVHDIELIDLAVSSASVSFVGLLDSTVSVDIAFDTPAIVKVLGRGVTSSMERISSAAQHVVVTDGSGKAETELEFGNYMFCVIGGFPRDNEIAGCSESDIGIIQDSTLVVVGPFVNLKDG